eukprot:TRINITY_DN74331_c0_g1_i1.p2 TRINITY_DN74331_c0_g1~~TRINITY_DN74331_c0_g1_i1.p2  ORF type:complete len:197 (-),score=8.75 TRINITY_DN74331_c0_g1_i1:103-693(-)
MSSFGKDGSSKVVMDVFSFCLSISSAVFIVFVNKILMGTSGYGYGFTFATTLSSFHFLSCWIYISSAQFMGLVKRISIPIIDALLFCLIADVSIASLNLSLMINSVGFYQMAKLLNIPFIAVVEFIFYGKKFSLEMLVSMIITIFQEKKKKKKKKLFPDRCSHQNFINKYNEDGTTNAQAKRENVHYNFATAILPK